ncbi:ABC transporter permease [Variovorax robiniae]|uniref:ABC transporter permease n=1 Tax=Variovorax robiniae TaxID=1836199 RepID=A0ABU8X9W9_9BURK
MTALRSQGMAVPAWSKPLIGLSGFLLLWQAVVLVGGISEEYLPGVPAVAQALWVQLTDRDFWTSEGLTLVRAVGGLLLATLTGVGAALLGARYRVIDRALSPLVQVMLSLPPAALVPLAIFGLGLGAKLFAFIIWFAAVWNIYVNAQSALAASEPVQLHVARTLGYGGWDTLWRVRLPAALPEIFTGIRVAAAGSLMATVAAEMLAGKDGLGFMLYDTAFALRIPEMFALLAVAGLNGVLVNALIVRLRRALAGWHDKLAAMAQA